MTAEEQSNLALVRSYLAAIESGEAAQGSRVAIEAKWTGTLAIPLGTLEPGSEMRAHFAIFLEFRDGKIAVQRNYDCFEAW